MELHSYFSRIEEIEQSIDTPFVAIVSEQTSDGGKAGVVSEVTRATAARLIAEGRARFASPKEAQLYKEAAERAVSISCEGAAGREQKKDCGDSATPRLARKPLRPTQG